MIPNTIQILCKYNIEKIVTRKMSICAHLAHMRSLYPPQKKVRIKDVMYRSKQLIPTVKVSPYIGMDGFRMHDLF